MLSDALKMVTHSGLKKRLARLAACSKLLWLQRVKAALVMETIELIPNNILYIEIEYEDTNQACLDYLAEYKSDSITSAAVDTTNKINYVELGINYQDTINSSSDGCAFSDAWSNPTNFQNLDAAPSDDAMVYSTNKSMYALEFLDSTGQIIGLENTCNPFQATASVIQSPQRVLLGQGFLRFKYIYSYHAVGLYTTFTYSEGPNHLILGENWEGNQDQGLGACVYWTKLVYDTACVKLIGTQVNMIVERVHGNPNQFRVFYRQQKVVNSISFAQASQPIQQTKLESGQTVSVQALTIDPAIADVSNCFHFLYTLNEITAANSLADQGVSGLSLDTVTMTISIPQFPTTVTAGIYTFRIQVNSLYDTSLTASYTLDIDVKENCSPLGGLAIIEDAAPETLLVYDYSGDLLTFSDGSALNFSSFYSTNIAGCPIMEYGCIETTSGGAGDLSDCTYSDSLSEVAFDTQTSALSILSSDVASSVLAPAIYSFSITILAGTLLDVSFTKQIEVQFRCSVTDEQAVLQVTQTQIETELVIRSYDSAWTFASPPMNPFVGLSPIYTTTTGCPVVLPVAWRSIRVTYDADGVTVLSTDIVQNTDINLLHNDVTTQTPGQFQQFFFQMFNWGNRECPSGQCNGPSVTHLVLLVDGYTKLSLHSYRQGPKTIDMLQPAANLGQEFSSPLFVDDLQATFELLDPSNPLRAVYFKIQDHEDEPTSKFFTYQVVDNTLPGRVSIDFQSVATCALETFGAIVCFSYGDYPNLQDLCDDDNVHSVVNSLGDCFAGARLSFIEWPETENSWTVNLSDNYTQQEMLSVADLSIFVLDQADLSLACGPLGFMLADSSDEVLVSISTDGLVSLQSTIGTSEIGSHEVGVKIFDRELDPSGLFPWTMDQKLVVTVVQGVASSFIAEITKDAPVAVSPIAPTYEFHADKKEASQLILKFADPLALAIEAGQADSQSVLPQGLVIALDQETSIPQIVVQATDYSKGSGFGSITLVVDWDSFEASAASEGKVEGQSTIKVKDTSPNGLEAVFILNFQIFAADFVAEEAVDAEQEQQLVEVLKKVAKKEEMSIMVSQALSKSDKEAEQGEETTIEASLNRISEFGEVFIDFEPPVVMIPNDWGQLWDLSEREKMLNEDRAQFEEELDQILQVQFIQNSEELPQKYFHSNLTSFEQSGIQIKLNFSDPVLISQSTQADQLKIRMLKSYFMRPTNRLVQGRSLVPLEQDEEYLTITADIPKQLLSEDEQVTLQFLASTTTAMLTTSFALTFIINLLLNGVMSQLWNIFNTLQILMALPLLSVLVPANVQFMVEIMQQIVNFSIVEKKSLYNKIVVPLLGDSSSAETSILVQLIQLVCALLVLTLLIGIVVVIRNKCMPKCCPCFQKLVNFIKAKLMFNSILRALMQTFFLNCVMMWTSFKQTKALQSNEQIVDLCLAVAILLFALAFPFFSYTFLKKRQTLTREAQFKMKYDSLYQNVDYYKLKALAFTSLFLARRLLFAFVLVFCAVSIVLQVFLADILSTLLLAFYLSVWPMWDSVNNCIQVFNEVVVLTSVWLVFQFTEFVPEPETRHTFGWNLLYFIGVNVALNVFVLVFTIGRKIYSSCRKVYLARKLKQLQHVQVEQHKQEPLEQVSESEENKLQLNRRRQDISKYLGVSDHSSSDAQSLQLKNVNPPQSSVLSSLQKSSSFSSSESHSRSQSQSSKQGDSEQSSSSLSQQSVTQEADLKTKDQSGDILLSRKDADRAGVSGDLNAQIQLQFRNILLKTRHILYPQVDQTDAQRRDRSESQRERKAQFALEEEILAFGQTQNQTTQPLQVNATRSNMISSSSSSAISSSRAGGRQSQDGQIEEVSMTAKSSPCRVSARSICNSSSVSSPSQSDLSSSSSSSGSSQASSDQA